MIAFSDETYSNRRGTVTTTCDQTIVLYVSIATSFVEASSMAAKCAEAAAVLDFYPTQEWPTLRSDRPPAWMIRSLRNGFDRPGRELRHRGGFRNFHK